MVQNGIVKVEGRTLKSGILTQSAVKDLLKKNQRNFVIVDHETKSHAVFL